MGTSEGTPGQGARRRRPRRTEDRPAPERPEPTSPRWAKESGSKICLKCGGRMYPADWIWQKYGLCVGWRCSQCKEKVMARSLPFKGLRKRTLEPDEIADLAAHAQGPDETAVGGQAPSQPRPRAEASGPRPRASTPRRAPQGRTPRGRG
jgi:hypothetical protein